MGLKHKAKKGTTITANGVTVAVLRGSPLLEITAPTEVRIETTSVHARLAVPNARRGGLCKRARRIDKQIGFRK